MQRMDKGCKKDVEGDKKVMVHQPNYEETQSMDPFLVSQTKHCCGAQSEVFVIHTVTANNAGYNMILLH